ncbi:MAG TPA: polysaccharide deacetylase family protein [Bryobacteraceae bacterium]|nr:polysaccharide deacetylase family protein [Bryobacteraceae bacterium]
MPSAKVTLTFDNGPEPRVTPGVLECLARRNIKTTFFVLGQKAGTPEGRALAQRARAEGHWIGNHTFTHSAPLGQLDRDAALREFERTAEVLAWLDQPQHLFRPKGGGRLGPHLLHPAVVEELQARRYTCVLWNSVPGDFRDPDGWLPRALADCRSREWTLLVLHDLPNGAMAHLDEFLARLQDDNFALTQEFPPDCLPIVEGRIVLPIQAFTPAL